MPDALTKQRPGCYRLSLPSGRYFAQFVRGRYHCSAKWGEYFKPDSTRGHHWRAEIRNRNTGELLRYAGVYPRLTDAVESVNTINPVDL